MQDALNEKYRPLAAFQKKLPHELALPTLTAADLAQITNRLAKRAGYIIHCDECQGQHNHQIMHNYGWFCGFAREIPAESMALCFLR